MLLAPDIESIFGRLKCVHHTPWGDADGLRYVCILFWDETGYRLIQNCVSPGDWFRMGMSSGESWDLFLAGCATADSDWYEDYAQMHLPGTPGNVYWMPAKSRELGIAVSEKVGSRGPMDSWNFEGPIELVTIGARRSLGQVYIDWNSLRSAKIRAQQIQEAVAHYTVAHLPGKHFDHEWPDSLPRPGDFSDDTLEGVPGQLVRKVGLMSSIVRIIRATFGG